MIKRTGAICIQVKRGGDATCSTEAKAPQVCKVLLVQVLPLTFFFLLCLVSYGGGNGQYREKSLGGSRAFTTYCGILAK